MDCCFVESQWSAHRILIELYVRMDVHWAGLIYVRKQSKKRCMNGLKMLSRCDLLCLCGFGGALKILDPRANYLAGRKGGGGGYSLLQAKGFSGSPCWANFSSRA